MTTAAAVPRAERPVYKLTGGQWRMLKDIALRELSGHATTAYRLTDLRALVSRGLLTATPIGMGNRHADAALTDLGKRVYSRLSVGTFCDLCGKPLAFCRTVNLPGGRAECESCARAL